MKIIKHQPPQQMNESSTMEMADMLFESYSRSRNMNDFLAENGNTPDNVAIYNYITLNESIIDEDKRMVFENGMFIPNTNVKSTGRLSLHTMCENSASVEDFISNVTTEICESKLGFTPTETDIKSLTESYISYKNSQSIND